MHTHGEKKGQDILKKSDTHHEYMLRQHADGHLQQPLAVQHCAKKGVDSSRQADGHHQEPLAVQLGAKKRVNN